MLKAKPSQLFKEKQLPKFKEYEKKTISRLSFFVNFIEVQFHLVFLVVLHFFLQIAILFASQFSPINFSNKIKTQPNAVYITFNWVSLVQLKGFVRSEATEQRAYFLSILAVVASVTYFELSLSVHQSWREFGAIKKDLVSQVFFCCDFFASHAFGATEGIRTPDRSVRSRVLYPAELQLH